LTVPSHCSSPYSLVNFVAFFPLFLCTCTLVCLLYHSPSPPLRQPFAYPLPSLPLPEPSLRLPSPPFASLPLPSPPFAFLRLPSPPFVSLRFPSLSLRPLFVLNLFSLRPPSTFRPKTFFVYGFVYLQNSRVFLVSCFFCFTLRLFFF
jgi:hypothetical protein